MSEVVESKAKRKRKRKHEMNEMAAHILHYIVEFKALNDGNSPTIREIADATWQSSSGVYYHLETLELHGAIKRIGNKYERRIVVVGGQWSPPRTI